jgi:DNA mismatch repair ATPase MutS
MNRWQRNLENYYFLKGKLAEKIGKNCILFFDMGAHYMTYFNDAECTSKIVDLEMRVLGSVEDKKISACRFKKSDLQGVTEKLLSRGKSVAICEAGSDEKPKIVNDNKVIDFFQFRHAGQS